ncbi:stau [Drosophila virilis]|uniref:Stau n=1 Tax=Drosophila virilis TaxID=7244 RepID=B4LJX4_DROVI|nr:stau [Drosophila virilis]
MQHHVHAARTAPHLRAAHHHGHIALPPHPGMEPHLGTLAAAASLATQQQQQQAPPPPQRDHGRFNLTYTCSLNHHHHQQQQHHPQQQQQHPQSNAAYHNNSSNNDNNSNNNNQMQKIRQQHQHLNSNSNGHLTKCNQAPPPPPQAYNHLAGNPAALSYGQLPHHMTHLGSYAAQPPPPAVLSGGKQQHYYLGSGKPSKYNNNNNNNNSGSSGSYSHASKTILQNTYRHAKSNGQLPVAATEAPVVAGATAATAAAAAEHALPSTLRILGNCRSSNGDSIVIASNEASELPPAESPDNCEPVKEATLTQDEDCTSSAEQLDAAGTLSNEDGSAARGSKDKTPMCLVNELARYNKITHQYRLTGERGPAHCKTFTVTLKLGEEEYSADGFKIKKAQHLAASKAIEETKYKHPPPKIRRNEEGSSTRTHITPTVELNALAMKLGQRTYYLLDPTQMPPADAMLPPEYATPLLPTPAAGLPPPPPPPYALRRNANGGYVLPPPTMHPHHHVAIQTQRGIYGHQRPFAPKYQSRYALAPALGPHMLAGPHGPYAAALPVTPSKITLFVGKQKFVGVGRTLQQAKHDAAARALQVLKTQSNSSADEALDDSMDEGDKKSPISQVHEIGIKRNMTVHFKVLREEGPAHMKNFITACIVGSIVTEGEGNGKKLSKKRAAEKMLSELQKLPPLTPTKQTPMKRIKVKTPGKGSASAAVTGMSAAGTVTPLGKPERRKRLSAPLKEKTILELDDAENPITKLIQLQQTRKEKEPIFELIAKNGNETSRRREFVMEVSASGSIARGTGNSKKLAKRNAAQALLELLETTEQNGGDSEHALEHNLPAATAVSLGGLTIESTGGLDVPMVSTPAGPVPGILILRQNKKPAKKKDAGVKANVEPAKEKEAKKEAIITATVTEGKSSRNSSSNNESNAHEAANESSLNTSTGSNTSGVSSNSSNAPASSSGNNASGGGDGSSSSAGGGGASGGGGSGGGGGVHMKEQLIYLSKLLDFEVNFSDYPKGNHNEFLTIVTLSTTPPQICHGVGKSCEESQNAAARNALKILSELGLNNAKK